MFEQHALTLLSSNSIDDCSSWWFDGPWKSEGVFRLTSMEFSAMFFLLILSATMVTITIAKILKILKIFQERIEVRRILIAAKLF